MPTRLGRDFYDRPTLRVARDLLADERERTGGRLHPVRRVEVVLDEDGDAMERPAQLDAGRPAWLLVLMHGVGSNEQDLFGLVPYVPPQFHVLSLRAPFAMGMGAYAWFQFTVDADGTRHINVPQEQQARILLQQTVEQAAQHHGVGMGHRVVDRRVIRRAVVAAALLGAERGMVEVVGRRPRRGA